VATPVDSVSLGYKIASLGWDVYKTFRNSAQLRTGRAGYRFTSSLTTLEFSYSGEQQQANYVQDRTILFLRDEVRLPPFLYRTDGEDKIDQLLVNESARPFKIVPEGGGGKFIEADEHIHYSKKDVVRAVLFASSTNGYPNRVEYFDLRIVDYIDKLTFFVIFPPEKMIKKVILYYQLREDSSTTWKPATREKYEVRHTTQRRRAFVWEAIAPKHGNKFRVEWEW